MGSNISGPNTSVAFTLGHVLNCKNVFLWRNGCDERRVREVKECENEVSVCATVPACLVVDARSSTSILPRGAADVRRAAARPTFQYSSSRNSQPCITQMDLGSCESGGVFTYDVGFQ